MKNKWKNKYKINMSSTINECGIMYNMVLSGYFDEFLTIEEKDKIIKLLAVTKTNEEFFDLDFFKENKRIYKMMIDKLSGKNEANNAPPCNVCGSDRFYVDLQRRAGDEARNFEIHCPGCGGIQYL